MIIVDENNADIYGLIITSSNNSTTSSDNNNINK